MSYTDRKNIERVTNIKYTTWAQKKILQYTLIEKCQKGNEYAYRIYELGTRKNSMSH